MCPKPRLTNRTSLSESDPARLLVMTRAALSGASPGRGDYLSPTKRPCLALKTSLSGLTRGLAILEQLFAAARGAGHGVSVTPEGTYLSVAGELLAMELRELRRKVPHEPTKEEITRRRQYPNLPAYELQFDLQPTGKFMLVMEERSYLSCKTSWHETPTRSFEDLVDAVITGLLNIAQTKSSRREAEQRAQEESRARQQAALIAEDRRRQEQRALERLVQQARDWKQAEEIREFVAAVRAAVERQGPSDVPAELWEWEARCLAIAARLDPMGRQPIEALIGRSYERAPTP